MTRYMISMRYSAGSWARMITSHGDRAKALRRKIEDPGGSLDCVYWEFGTLLWREPNSGANGDGSRRTGAD